ncbi:hypothetical protein Gotur_018833 [Gossypium turneri]
MLKRLAWWEELVVLKELAVMMQMFRMQQFKKELAEQKLLKVLQLVKQYSIDVHVMVYNTRIFILVDWLRCEFTNVDNEYAGFGKRVYVGRVLALANMGFWCFNLFGFLLPVYLPKAFKMYYSETKVSYIYAYMCNLTFEATPYPKVLNSSPTDDFMKYEDINWAYENIIDSENAHGRESDDDDDNDDGDDDGESNNSSGFEMKLTRDAIVSSLMNSL